MNRKILLELLAFLFIVLFVYAAVTKLLDYQKFTIQIGQSPLLTGFGHVIPWMVIIIEIVIAAMLLIPSLRVFAFLSAFCLMIVFTAYIIAILSVSPYLPCSCGGILERLGWTEHLLFNGVFVALSVGGVLLAMREESSEKIISRWIPIAREKIARHRLLVFGMSVMVGLGVVAMFVIFSVHIRKQPGAFYREFPPHPVAEGKVYKLDHDRYYFAGGTSEHLYLGNYASPLDLVVIHTLSRDTHHVRLKISSIEKQKFWGLRIRVEPPYYYVTDGTIPILYRGNIHDWHAEPYWPANAYFQDILPLTPNSFFIRSLRYPSRENTLGKIVGEEVYLLPDILEKQVDGIFCTDGTMLYNATRHELLYTYRYRNEWIVMDTLLRVLYRHHTIDPTVRVRMRVDTLPNGATTLATPSETVNKTTSTWGDLLFVQSMLLAKNEVSEAHRQANVIDVYRVSTGSYLFSFYLYSPAANKPLRTFQVTENQLYALHGEYLQVWNLAEAYITD